MNFNNLSGDSVFLIRGEGPYMTILEYHFTYKESRINVLDIGSHSSDYKEQVLSPGI
jgi:hypothetical protein